MSDTAAIRLRDGAELWTAVSGTGPPIVLLHGGPGLWDYLAPLAALLDGEFTVARFDQRGCGRSTGRGGPFTIEQAVDDMDQVRSALGFSRRAVVGHSWGAELALRYAARYPDRVTAVAYIGGVGAGNGFRDAHKAGPGRRLGPDRAVRDPRRRPHARRGTRAVPAPVAHRLLPGARRRRARPGTAGDPAARCRRQHGGQPGTAG